MIENNYSLKRQVANTLRKTPLYPVAKSLYRNILNRDYIQERNDLISLLSQFVSPGDLVFDVGANMGDYVDVLLRIGAKVCAVEPNSFCVDEIKSLYGNNPNLVIIDYALGSSEGEGTMYLGGSGMHNVSTMSEEWKEKAQTRPGLNKAGWDNQIKVEIKTLDHLIAAYGVPKFCKIDVEGFEYEVLKGLNQPLPMISLEYTPWRMEPSILCIDHLSNLGSCEFNITMNRSRKNVGQLHFNEWVDKGTIIDLLNNDVRDTNTVGDLYIKAKP
jgi:FkbM family methyltransferase